jgi:manganese transport system ATP-binding protein
MAQDHDLLLLDEPLTGIDLTTAQAIDGAIHAEIERGCTVILTTHDLSEAQVADYVVLLAGRVVAAGPPEEVLIAEHLANAYGPSLLHVTENRIFIDDAAHQPVNERHEHKRSVHPESSRADVHPD